MNIKSKTVSELKKIAREVEQELRIRGATNKIGDVTIKELDTLVKKMKPLIEGKKIKFTIKPEIKIETYVCISDSGGIDWRYADQLENFVYDDIYDSVVNNEKFCSEVNKAREKFDKVDDYIKKLSHKYNVDEYDLFEVACEMTVRSVDFAPGYDY